MNHSTSDLANVLGPDLIVTEQADDLASEVRDLFPRKFSCYKFVEYLVICLWLDAFIQDGHQDLTKCYNELQCFPWV